ncbi:PilZ domain-containing protein [Methylobacterium sp. C25]|uniref:PilZ domain-containing protein n=1 Tax=Methylobacterium sp. C25 TaxID=2721622 RepID=UPI001F1F79D6|nr:PilZ domain-containing protein [Methylobacterium sp. C25]MCE4222698.1 PilZ domain-containing protein [Methylobacterium sp. C25]
MITRAEERRETNWIAMIRLADGTEIPCTVKDVSKSGARLGVPSKIELPDHFKFKVLGRDFVCAVKVAWRRGEYVGVTIEQVGKLKQPAAKETPEPTAAPPEASNTIQARRSRFAER